MKYKILTILVITCLILSGIGVVAIQITEETGLQKSDSNIKNFPTKTITQIGEYLSLNVKGTNTFLMSPKKPMLPVYIEKYTFPLGTKIKVVDCVQLSDIKHEIIWGKVKPAPEPIPLIYNERSTNNDTVEKIVEDATVYNSPDLFPDSWFDYNIGCGMDGDEHVVILTVRYYPVRYSPLENTIYYVDKVDIKITFEEPAENPFPKAKQCDLVVISPRKFSLRLKPLVMHKKISGLKTTLKTTESIYRDFEGRDKPEQIKYFIKYAVEELGVKYVLLVGGLKSLISGTPRDNLNEGSKSWHVPVRYSNLVDPYGLKDPGYICDLYYADVYKYNESSHEYEFDDWDSNGNGIFGEWDDENKDVIDIYPDVYVGRLACRNIFEVGIMSRKIIRYETQILGKKWFNRMLCVGGDTFASKYDDYYEGEIETNLSASYMDGFEIIRLWASQGTLTLKNFLKTFSKGAGFVHLTGHSNPGSWGTYLPNDDVNFSIDLWYVDLIKLRNIYKLPVVVWGGCHTSQFNITFLSTLRDPRNHNSTWCYGSGTPECLSWWLTRKIGGGSIATIGNTGLGYGIPGEGCTSGTGGWIETRFFHVYNQQNKTILGETHSQTITDYIDHFDINYDIIDRKTVEQWVLLGDPSLRIGGK